MSVVESVVVFPEPMTGCGHDCAKVRWRLAFAGREGLMIKGERVSMDHSYGSRVSAAVGSPSRASSLPQWFGGEHSFYEHQRTTVGASLLAIASALPTQIRNTALQSHPADDQSFLAAPSTYRPALQDRKSVV